MLEFVTISVSLRFSLVKVYDSISSSTPQCMAFPYRLLFFLKEMWAPSEISFTRGSHSDGYFI